jgi:exo-beta-1,3-glucanase (GH17 family)
VQLRTLGIFKGLLLNMLRGMLIAVVAVAGCSSDTQERPARQAADDLLAGQVMAVSYSGYRDGQHPDRGAGAMNPGRDEILEDLEILLAHDFHLIRLYDSGVNSLATLELIREHDLPIKVLLGMWLEAEFSNHEGCPWLHEPIPDEKLAANALKNVVEIQRGVELARRFSDVVVAVNVGNEALVDWNDHMVPVEKVISYVQRVKASIEQPITVADNYAWWARDGAQLAAEVDFLGVHIYPLWEYKTVDQALAYSMHNIRQVQAALPGKPIAILEAGWATAGSGFEEQANEANQKRHFRELLEWARSSNTTVFFFEAFDEPWKGDPNNPADMEKHWGLFNADRSPKQVFQVSPEIKTP